MLFCNQQPPLLPQGHSTSDLEIGILALLVLEITIITEYSLVPLLNTMSVRFIHTVASLSDVLFLITM